MKNRTSTGLVYFGLLGVYIIAAFSPFLFATNEQILPHIKETGIYQLATALAFLLASVFLGMAYAKPGNGNDFIKVVTKRNVFVLLLAIVFFVGAGEELSWGQHLLGFEPPESVADRNVQGEFNLHNLELLHGRNRDGSPKTGLAMYLTIGKLFSLFWFGFCVCLPLIDWVSQKANRFFKIVNMPIVPLWIGMAFPLNHLLSKLIVQFTDARGHYVVEVKESGFAVLFLVFAIWYWLSVKRANLSAQRSPH